MTDFIPMTGKELIRRMLEGERDFSRTRLSAGTDLNGEAGFGEMVAYLQKQDLRAEPVIVEEADWRGLRATGLFLPSAHLAGADLSGADLSGSDLRRAVLTGASLQRANLEGATLLHCRLVETNLTGANMRGADLYEARVNGTLFRNVDLAFAHMLRVVFESGDLTGAAVGGTDSYRSDLRNAAGLDSVRDLGRALFHRTIVTPQQLEIIQAAFGSLPLFDVQQAGPVKTRERR